MPSFDPDAYLAASPAAPGTDADAGAPPEDHDLDFLSPGYKRPPKASPGGFDPDAYLGTETPAPPPEDAIGRANREYQANVAALKSPPQAQQRNLPQTSRMGAVAAGAGQGVFGLGDEMAGYAMGLVNSISKHELLSQDARRREYETSRDAARDYDEAAKQQHRGLFTASQVGGALATAAIPGSSLARGAGALEAAGQGALIGGLTGAGESEGTSAKDVIGDALKGGAIGAAGGAILHPIATKVVAPLAEKVVSKLAGKAATLADEQASAQLSRQVPQSLTDPMTQDPNLSAALNEKISVGPKKTVTLAQIAGKKAEEVRPIIQAKQAEIDQKIAGLLGKSGEPNLGDLADRYDAEINRLKANPGNEKAIRELEKARQETTERWGPSEEARQAKLDEIGEQTGKIYDKSDAKVGGATLGDLIQHYNNDIAAMSKDPTKGAYVQAVTKARDEAIKAWGTRPVFDAEAAVADGPFAGGKAGDAVAKLEKMAQARPAQATELTAEAQRIRDAATTQGFDPTVKIPARDVRGYATFLQNEADTGITDPKAAGMARRFMGSTTKNFVNQHVGATVGPEDRAALEALNGRTSNLLKWDNVVSGKEADPAVRNAVLKEFGGQKISPHDLDAYASKLEAEGRDGIAKLTPTTTMKAKAAKGSVTRGYADEHTAKNLSAADAAELERQMAMRQSMKNIDDVVARRLGKERADKVGIGQVIGHAAASSPGLTLIGHGTSKILTGDVGRGLAEAGSGALMTAAPFAIKNARAIGRAAVRGVASGADYLAKVATAAEAGNPWARRMMDTLRQTPGGAARLAAALARVRGGAAPAGGPPPVSEAP